MGRVHAVALAALATLLPAPLGAQTPDAQFRADIRQLMEVTGAASVGTQLASLVSAPLFANLKKMNPDLPDRAIDVIREVLTAEMSQMLSGPGGIEDELITAYAQHFTPRDVKELLDFYNSPVGRKAIKAMPSLAQRGNEIGQTWWQANLPRVLGVLQQRLQAEGLLKN